MVAKVAKDYIIKKNYHITDLISKRQSTANKYFIIYKNKNTIEHYRYAISVGKKYGNAVQRNKIKRQIRSIIYNISDSLKDNFDILIIIRPKTNVLTFFEIETNVKHVLSKANLFKSEDK
jgi:ribonuclease P protein component